MSVSGPVGASLEMLADRICEVHMLDHPGRGPLRALELALILGFGMAATAASSPSPGCLPEFNPTICTLPPSSGISAWWQDLIDLDAVPEYDGTGVTVVVMEEGFPQNADFYLPADHIDYTYAASFGPQGNGSDKSVHQSSPAFGLKAGHAILVAGLIVGWVEVPKPVDAVYGSTQPGAAPGAKVVPVRIFNELKFEDKNDLAPPSSIPAAAAAFRYVARLKAEGKLGPVIINCSFGLDASQDLLDAIDEAIAQGVIVIASAGNDGPGDNTVNPAPAGHAPVITVGGVGWIREGSFPEDACRRWWFEDVVEGPDPASEVYVTKFSSRGPEVDVVAPALFIPSWEPDGHGVNVIEYPDNDISAVPTYYIGDAGTSIAAPLVSSVVARMLQKNPTLTQGQVEGILKASAFPIPAAPNGVQTTYSRCLDDPIYDVLYQDGRVPPWGATATGAGLVNARRALDLTPSP